MGHLSDADHILPKHVRTQALIAASFQSRQGSSYVSDVHEAGGWRLRHPHGPLCEAVIVNTGGGIVGGDHISLEFNIGADADVLITSQAAEKIYKAQAEEAQAHISLRLGPQARLGWLSQEMILFDGARFKRRLDVDMHADAQLTMIESTIFGRLAMGEQIEHGLLRDRWRIRREQKLLFAEDISFDGAIAAHLNHPTIGGGARSSALIVHIAPDSLAQAEPLRAQLNTCHHAVEWGVSAWNDMLIMRMLAHDPQALRALSQMALVFLRGHDMPRVWQ